MSGNETWRNWAILFVLLIVFALATALWSSISPDINLFSGGNRTEIPSVPVEVEPITFAVPALGIGPFEFTPFAVTGILAGIVIGGIVVVGAVIAFINLFISRQVTAVFASDAFKEGQSRLEQKEKAELKQMNEGRSITKPEHHRPVWSAVSTSLIVLLFVWFGGMIINGTIFPNGEAISAAGEPVSTAPRVIVPLLLIALLVLAIRMRPQKMVSAESTDSASIPWDSIAVLILGLLVVGLGIAAMMFLLGTA